MRMYNPEWEAIKDFDYTPRVLDVQFELSAGEIPAEHGVSLYEALIRYLPWLAQTPSVGIHPIHGAPTGRNENLVVNRRVKLVLRLPVERVADAQVLSGREIDPGAGPIRLGALKAKQLTPYATLYSPFVATGSAEEVAFLEDVRLELEGKGVRCGLIPGKQRKMYTPEGEVIGYSLMLHDISLMQSLEIQEVGLGLYRMYGCGIFVPHKSIKEVVID